MLSAPSAVILFLGIQSFASSTSFSDLFIGGVSLSFWSSLLQNNASHGHLSSQCSQSLSIIRQGIENDDSFSFTFLDASSKSVGLLEGTTTSMGDYDQCLAIDSPAGVGKYCMIESVWDDDVIHETTSDIRKKIRKIYPVAGMYNTHESLCVPHSCLPSDVGHVIDSARKGLGIRIQSLNCTTLNENTFSHKIRTMKPGQKIALAIVMVSITLVAVTTVIDHYWQSENCILKSFSLTRNVRALTTSTDHHMQMIDLFKISVIIPGVVSHTISCFETPFGFYLIRRMHRDVLGELSALWKQPFSNEQGLGSITFYGGILFGMSIFPKIEKGCLRTTAAILIKYYKLVVPIIFLMCLDLLWPLLADGPLVPLMEGDIVHKCSHNYWRNILMISNFHNAAGTCAAHTFYSSVDFHMFLLGIILSFMYKRSMRTGVVVATMFALIGLGTTSFLSYRMRQPTLMRRNVLAHDVIDYLSYIHFPSYSYLIYYTSGFTMGAFFYKGFTATRRHVWISSLSILPAFLVAAFSPAVYNAFDLELDAITIPVFIILTRISWLICFVTSVIAFMAAAGYSKFPDSGSTGTPEEMDRVDTYGMRIWKMVCRLSFSLYMINYWIIRYHFFTSRVLFTVTFYDFIFRAVALLFLSMLAAVPFHLLFVAPYDQLRRAFVGSMNKAKCKRQ